MSLALLLLVAAALIATVMPRVLESTRLAVTRPAVVLVAWLTSIGAVLLFTGSAVLMLLGPEHPPAEAAVDAVLRCLSAFHHTTRPWVSDVMTIVTTCAAMALTARAVVFSRRHRAVRQRVQQRHRDTLSVVARRRSESDVMWLDHAVPLAYAVGGRPGFVVATDGLSSMLTHRERDAVLAHERAHLRGHHHRIAAFCDVLATALPFVPLFRRAPRAVRTLLELLSDHHAARATSPAVVRSALAAVTSAGTPLAPEWSLRAGDDTAVRLESLAFDVPRRFPRFACLSAAITVVTVPALASLAFVTLSSVGACLLLS